MTFDPEKTRISKTQYVSAEGVQPAKPKGHRFPREKSSDPVQDAEYEAHVDARVPAAKEAEDSLNLYDVAVDLTDKGPVTRVVREYVYDADSKLLWITEYDDHGHATSKAHTYFATDPIPAISKAKNANRAA